MANIRYIRPYFDPRDFRQRTNRARGIESNHRKLSIRNLAADERENFAAEDSPVLARYSVFALAWSVLAALFAIAMTFRYQPTLEELAPAEWIVWLAMGIGWVAVFVPVIVVLARPLAQRLRPES